MDWCLRLKQESCGKLGHCKERVNDPLEVPLKVLLEYPLKSPVLNVILNAKDQLTECTEFVQSDNGPEPELDN